MHARDMIQVVLSIQAGRVMPSMLLRKLSTCTAFGRHRFRHAMGTTAPITDPAHPGVAAAILGISEAMVEKHYNLASQADVASIFHASLRKNRAATQSVARREFRRGGAKCLDRG